MAQSFVPGTNYLCGAVDGSRGCESYPVAGGGIQHGNGLQGSSSVNQEIGLSANVPRGTNILGLKFIQTPSFVDFIEMKIAQEEAQWEQKARYLRSQEDTGKLRASNINATSIQIGSWKRVATYKGDIMAKFYFSRRRIVWEILHNDLKGKMEIPWDNVRAIKAFFNKGQPDTLKVQLKQEPEYFQEEPVQAKMHTLWETCLDFTCGQAGTYRLHLVIFPEGTLAEHYDKLIYSEYRFYLLNQVPFPTSKSKLDDMFPDQIQQVTRQQNPPQISNALILGAKSISLQNIAQAIHPTSTHMLPHQTSNNYHQSNLTPAGAPASPLTNSLNWRNETECGAGYQIRMPIQGPASPPLEGFNSMNQRGYGFCGQYSITTPSDYNQAEEVDPGPEGLMLMNSNGRDLGL